MSVDVGEAVLTILADTKPLDAQLAKIQRAIQSMRDVLNEDEPATESPKFYPNPSRPVSTRDPNDVLVR